MTTASAETDSTVQQPVSYAPGAVRSVLSNWGAYAFAVIITLFLSPFVVHHLGNATYGIWVLISSLTGYLGLLDLGVRGAVTRYVAKFHAQAKNDDASKVVSSSLAIFMVAGVVAILISLALATLGINSFHIPDVYRTPARLVFLIAGVNVAVSVGVALTVLVLFLIWGCTAS
jgi:O-antigen/teichoic acid export membrane protein